jgi:hypothetical protein
MIRIHISHRIRRPDEITYHCDKITIPVSSVRADSPSRMFTRLQLTLYIIISLSVSTDTGIRICARTLADRPLQLRRQEWKRNDDYREVNKALMRQREREREKEKERNNEKLDTYTRRDLWR